MGKAVAGRRVVGTGDSQKVLSSAPAASSNWSEELVKEIAMDIGKEVVTCVEVMYPAAITATSSTFKFSLRNSIYNEIMAAIKVNDGALVLERLERRKKFRRWWVGGYRYLRKQPTDKQGEGNAVRNPHRNCKNS